MKKHSIKTLNIFCLLFLQLFLFPSSLVGASPLLSVQVKAAIQERKMEGRITIVHDAHVKIATHTFKIGDHPLEVEPLPSDHPQKSLYRFLFTPPSAKGLQLLPVISVEIDGKKYQTSSLTYTISPSASQEPLLLSAGVQETPPFYPGQRLKLVYKIAFKGTIDLIKEELPLLRPQGFEKIGTVQVKESQEEGYDTQEITVEVRAQEPGTYSFGRSLIEGFIYRDIPGEAAPQKAAVRAVAPAFDVEILPFPEQGKPPSFSGALGKFAMAVERISPAKMNLGDELQLKITLSGEGDLDTVQIPYLFCQPGFSGFFAAGILPPQEKVEGKTKEFFIRLRPLSELIREVPPIEYASFDPLLRIYFTSRSSPLPFTILPLATAADAIKKKAEQRVRIEDDLEEDKTNWKSEISQISPLPSFFPLQAKKKGFFPTWNTFLYLLAVGIGFLSLQKLLIQRLSLLFFMMLPLSGISTEETVAQQTDTLNRSFDSWKKKEMDLSHIREKGKLYANLADAYFEMGMLPWAVLYDEKSLLYRSRDLARWQHLRSLQQRLTGHPFPEPTFFERVKIWCSFSEEETLQLSCLFLALLIGCLSVYFWAQNKLWKLGAILSGLCCLFFACYAFYLQFFTPIEGILVHASFLYRGAGTHYAQVKETPLRAGEKVTILSMTNNGQWWKIVTSEGNIGFVSNTSIRMI